MRTPVALYCFFFVFFLISPLVYRTTRRASPDAMSRVGSNRWLCSCMQWREPWMVSFMSVARRCAHVMSFFGHFFFPNKRSFRAASAEKKKDDTSDNM